MSPIIGTLLVVVITLLIASALTASLVAYGGSLERHKEGFDRAIGEESPWVGSPSGLVQPSNNEAGATDVRYRIHFEYDPKNGEATSLKKVDLTVNTGSPNMFSNTSEAKLEYVTVDTNSDDETDKYITSSVQDWSNSGDGTELEIKFDGGHVMEPGHSVVVVFGGVDNPTAPGVYELEVRTSGSGAKHTGNVTIV